jgi:uncharacterized membrane-anchored protein YitT (DUF2179 family)
MTYLTLLLIVKIVVTFLFVALPFLFLSRQRIEKNIQIQANNSLFFRLYGVAILALLVGYGSAIPLAEASILPTGILVMGLVSNAGASGLLFRLGNGKQSMLLAAFFGIIAVLLVVALLFPSAALTKLW